MDPTQTAGHPILRLRSGISSAIKQVRYRSRNRRTRAFVVSFPKTGRTWLRVMIGRVLTQHFGLDERALLDTYGISQGLRHGPLRFSHGGPLYLFDDRPYDQLTFDRALYENKRVVHLIRDVRDTLVSYFFQVSKREKVFAGDVRAFLADPRFGARKIVRFYTLWFQNRPIPSEMLVVRYEDLHRDPAAALCEVLRFVGLDGPLEQLARGAVEYASFENMRKLEADQRFDRDMMKPADPDDRESFKTRRGKVGGYVDYLDDAAQHYIEEVVAEVGDPGCDWFLYADAASARDRTEPSP